MLLYQYNSIEDLYRITYLSNINKSIYKSSKISKIYHTKWCHDYSILSQVYSIKITQKYNYIKVEIFYDNDLIRMPIYLSIKDNNQIDEIIYLIIEKKYNHISLFNTLHFRYDHIN